MPERSYRNELLDEWVGGLVLTGLVIAPQLEPEEAEDMGDNPEIFKSHLTQAARALYRLLAYDEIGITIRLAVDEEEPPIFVPWGAVLRLEGVRGPEEERAHQD